MSGSRSRTVAEPPRLAVVGTSGYAFSYLHRARILHDEGLVRFAGMADVRVGGAVLRAGGDLLLETPPVLDLAGFRTLSRLAAENGSACQTGFQSFGSPALPVLR